MLERDVERAFVRRLKNELGLRSAKLKAIANAGWPDRLVPLANGVTVYVELKAPRRENNLSAHQAAVIRRLRECGHPVLVTSSAEEAINFCIKHGMTKKLEV